VVPNQRLVGFARVDLKPGKAQTVQVSFPVTELAVTPGDIESLSPPQVEPGSYQVQIGTPATLSADFTIRG
jgi:hypothetical protein